MKQVYIFISCFLILLVILLAHKKYKSNPDISIGQCLIIDLSRYDEFSAPYLVYERVKLIGKKSVRVVSKHPGSAMPREKTVSFWELEYREKISNESCLKQGI
jgi:hypothetical protein